MKRSWFIRLKEIAARRSNKPWACFETSGPSPDGRVEFSISCNPAFTMALRAAGFEGTSEEEMVQSFFLAARMLPESVLNAEEDDTINPEGTPTLTSEANILKR
jgi:hypothetical protein